MNNPEAEPSGYHIGRRYAKLGFYLLLPTPAPLQRGFSQRDAFGVGNFGVPSSLNYSDPEGRGIEPPIN
jgi:hypothetical protein